MQSCQNILKLNLQMFQFIATKDMLSINIWKITKIIFENATNTNQGW